MLKLKFFSILAYQIIHAMFETLLLSFN